MRSRPGTRMALLTGGPVTVRPSGVGAGGGS
jgi:hypothetical protein